MYRIPYFTENDSQEILQFLQQHPFAMLIGTQDGIPVATQIPLLVEAKEDGLLLRGHIMRQTDHHKALVANPNALAIFTGPQCYISASWYSERGHGSTWNYMTVQLRGIIQFMDDEETIQLLTDLTNHFERDKQHPELVSGMTEEYIRSNVKAIAGFTILATDIKVTFKLSQNRDDESYQNIVSNLETSESNAEKDIAKEMKMRRPHLL